MKIKKWIFNTLAIVICIFTITIGVYAAKQASVTVSGQIGFNSNGCNVLVSATANAFVQDGTKATTVTLLTDKQVKGNVTEDVTSKPLYFSDLVENGNKITINVTVTNKTPIAVVGTVKTPTVKNGSTAVNYVTAEVSTPSFTLSVDGVTNLTITFTMTNIDAQSTVNLNYSLIFEFNRYDGPDLRSYLKRETTGNPNTGLDIGSVYVEMGEYNGTALKWYAFAYSEDGTDENMQAFGLVEAGKEKTIASGTYYFISEHILGSTASGLLGGGLSNYDMSTINISTLALLEDSTKYKIKNSALVQYLIARDLNVESYDYGGGGTGTTDSVAEDQKLWPLSCRYGDTTEYDFLTMHGAGGTVNTANCVSYSISDSTDNYWTRSLGTVAAGWSQVCYVNADGVVGRIGTYGDTETDSSGLRPCFCLEII